MPSIDQLYTWHIFFVRNNLFTFFEKEEELSKFIRKNGI